MNLITPEVIEQTRLVWLERQKPNAAYEMKEGYGQLSLLAFSEPKALKFSMRVNRGVGRGNTKGVTS